MSNEWKIVRLGDCSKVVMGQSPSSSSYNSDGGGLPFYQGNADFGVINPKVRYYCTEPTKFADVDSVLMSVRAPIGALNIANSYCCIGRGLCAISGIDGVSYFKYLYYYLLKKQAYIQSLGTGSTFKAVTGKVVNDLSITLPNIEKQREIAAVLDKASELVSKRKAQLAELDRLAESIFYDMFGDPVTNEKGWETKVLNDICTKITDGTHSSPNFIDKGVPFLLVSNIQNNELTYSTNKFISEEEYAILTKHTKIEQGDLLYTSVGSFGNPAIVKDKRKFCFQRHIAHLKPVHDIVNITFLHSVMKTDYVRNQAERLAIGVAQRTLNLSSIKIIRVILPPLQLQQQFAERIEKIEEQKQKVKTALKESEDLFQRLMQDMFNPDNKNS